MTQLYDRIGVDYRQRRRPDPRLAEQIRSRLPDRGTVVNLGAGTGSYEPTDLRVVAVEPSWTMIAQRSDGSAPAVRATAETVPFAAGSFTAALAILTIHHWQRRSDAFSEIRRVAVDLAVVVTWDPGHPGFWLTRDYFPEILGIDRAIFPPLAELEKAFGRVSVHPWLVPSDCTDGFLGAYWHRPEAYLDADVRRGMSTFAKIDVEPGLARLRADLESGAWQRRNAELAERSSADLGYRIVVAELGR
jgi:SAM-dependent methyltransferase